MSLSDFRLKKYAQTDEESVIYNLLDVLATSGPVEPFVVDIGAGPDATYSNSQVLVEEGWRSLRFDLRSTDDRHAKAIRVTAGNIVGLLEAENVPKNLGLLCLDIDGIDLYVLEAVLRGGYHPSIIVYEINGCRDPLSFDVISYDENFAHAADDYYGASWSAFQHVLNRYGYVSVHQTFSLNGFAVEKLRGIPECPPSPRSQYHAATRRPDARWVDIRHVFPST